MRSFKQFTTAESLETESLSNQKFNRSEISLSLQNAAYYEKVFDRYCYLVSKHL